MSKITRDSVTGLAHCAQQIDQYGELAYDVNGLPSGEDHCPGYRQVEVAAVRETLWRTYGDFNGNSAEPMDQALAGNISDSSSRLVWADLADQPCPHCGVARDLTDQVRPNYAPLGGQNGRPDQLLRDRRQRREQGEAMNKSADAATRQADALERANELKSAELALRERELDAQDQRAPLPATHRRKPPVKVEG